MYKLLTAGLKAPALTGYIGDAQGILLQKFCGAMLAKISQRTLSPKCFRDRKDTQKNLCDKDFAELSGDLSGAICLIYWVVPSNCSEKSLALFVRFFGSGVLFWLLSVVEAPSKSRTSGPSAFSPRFPEQQPECAQDSRPEKNFL